MMRVPIREYDVLHVLDHVVARHVPMALPVNESLAIDGGHVLGLLCIQPSSDSSGSLLVLVISDVGLRQHCICIDSVLQTVLDARPAYSSMARAHLIGSKSTRLHALALRASTSLLRQAVAAASALIARAKLACVA